MSGAVVVHFFGVVVRVVRGVGVVVRDVPVVVHFFGFVVRVVVRVVGVVVHVGGIVVGEASEIWRNARIRRRWKII